MNMMTAISTAIASPTAAPTLAASRVPEIDVVDRYRCAKAALQQVSIELDDAHEKVSDIHGHRPAALIAWRNYSAIGGSEIEAMRERLLAAGEDPQMVEEEYNAARKRYRAAIQAGKAWDKRADLEVLTRRAEASRKEFAACQDALKALSPSTSEGALSLLDVIRENVEGFESIEPWEISLLAKANRFLQSAVPLSAKQSIDRDQMELLKAREGEGLAQAFRGLESDICDLTRMARLAELQLQKAIGDLRYENGICVEAPDTEDAELATFAVSLLTEKVRELEGEWYRLFNEGVAAARNGGPPVAGRLRELVERWLMHQELCGLIIEKKAAAPFRVASRSFATWSAHASHSATDLPDTS
ncbi:hypothetical protein AOQ71_31905 [Bradyrhizobium manausense]|uniref:Uncharacterized protein n=1 Tax=Bradyrhizobium manausense TaxID=989370 RepID=A0A0R3D7G5_9BRAD|nr:hypothetical protein AOQ71_31905 [Bradyrhizobium manausense]